MTGGRAFLYDPDGRHLAALDTRSVHATRLASAAVDREDGPALVEELIALLEAHRSAGSRRADTLLHDLAAVCAEVWLVEPIPVTPPAVDPVRAVEAVSSAGARSASVPA